MNAGSVVFRIHLDGGFHDRNLLQIDSFSSLNVLNVECLAFPPKVVLGVVSFVVKLVKLQLFPLLFQFMIEVGHARKMLVVSFRSGQ